MLKIFRKEIQTQEAKKKNKTRHQHLHFPEFATKNLLEITAFSAMDSMDQGLGGDT